MRSSRQHVPHKDLQKKKSFHISKARREVEKSEHKFGFRVFPHFNFTFLCTPSAVVYSKPRPTTMSTTSYRFSRLWQHKRLECSVAFSVKQCSGRYRAWLNNSAFPKQPGKPTKDFLPLFHRHLYPRYSPQSNSNLWICSRGNRQVLLSLLLLK